MEGLEIGYNEYTNTSIQMECKIYPLVELCTRPIIPHEQICKIKYVQQLNHTFNRFQLQSKLLQENFKYEIV